MPDESHRNVREKRRALLPLLRPPLCPFIRTAALEAAKRPTRKVTVVEVVAQTDTSWCLTLVQERLETLDIFKTMVIRRTAALLRAEASCDDDDTKNY